MLFPPTAGFFSNLSQSECVTKTLYGENGRTIFRKGFALAA
jgi:hypothetical protein